MLGHHKRGMRSVDGRQNDKMGTSGQMQCFEDIDTKNLTLKALDLILAAWDEGVDTGVEPQQMAYAALFTALTDLVAIYGEDAVIHLTRGLEQRVLEGEFTLSRRDQ